MPKRLTADIYWLTRAIALSKQCPTSSRSFAVGAVIVAKEGNQISDGFSLEWEGRWHAEEIAIQKAIQKRRDLHGCTLYSSLEPCSVRLSGKRACVDHIIACGCSRVVFALHEPFLFVECKGEEMLKKRGIQVLCISELGPQVAEINRHLMAAAIESAKMR
ncbi:MAG: hypothetical protein WB791_02025 [Waddliaceae bacterium]